MKGGRLAKDYNDLLKTIKDGYNKSDGIITLVECVKTKNSREMINNSSFDDDYTDALNGSLNNMNDFTVVLRGPSDTPYSGGAFKLHFKVHSEYPFKPPTITFKTPICHPNINDNGTICLDILSTTSNQWTPVYTFVKIIMSISALLASPNPDDPLRAEIGTLYKTNKNKYLIKAIEETQTKAIIDPQRNYMTTK